LEADGKIQNGPWRIIRRHSINFQGNRVLYECLALANLSSTPLSVTTPKTVL
jgi:hypothetical protein